MKKIQWTALLCTALIVVCAACGSNTKTAQPGETTTGGNTAGGNTSGGNTSTTTVNAEAVYKANCLSCHGDQLQGTVGPNLQKAGSKLSQDQIASRITNGGGGMPAFKGKLNDNEIQALSSWLGAKK